MSPLSDHVWGFIICSIKRFYKNWVRVYVRARSMFCESFGFSRVSGRSLIFFYHIRSRLSVIHIHETWRVDWESTSECGRNLRCHPRGHTTAIETEEKVAIAYDATRWRHIHMYRESQNPEISHLRVIWVTWQAYIAANRCHSIFSDCEKQLASLIKAYEGRLWHSRKAIVIFIYKLCHEGVGRQHQNPWSHGLCASPN